MVGYSCTKQRPDTVHLRERIKLSRLDNFIHDLIAAVIFRQAVVDIQSSKEVNILVPP